MPNIEDQSIIATGRYWLFARCLSSRFSVQFPEEISSMQLSIQSCKFMFL